MSDPNNPEQIINNGNEKRRKHGREQISITTLGNIELRGQEQEKNNGAIN
jgi:hypothetical protein